jgi:hypothetical protein
MVHVVVGVDGVGAGQCNDVAFLAPDVHVGFKSGHISTLLRQQSWEPAGAPLSTHVHATHFASVLHAASQTAAS